MSVAEAAPKHPDSYCIILALDKNILFLSDEAEEITAEI
jgi:hypothetical protein